MIPADVPVSLDEATHTYTVRGERWPGVNEILAGAGVSDDLKAVPEHLLTMGRARGSAVHLATLYDDGDELDLSSVDDYTVGCVESWRGLCQHVGFEPILRERFVWSDRWRYVGTVDAFGLVWGDPWVLDIKGGLYRSAGPQTAAYFEAIREHGLKPKGRGIVHLYPDGRRGRIRPLTDPDDWRCFVSALNIVNWKAKHA